VVIGGGMGARNAGEPGHVCRPDLLVDAAAGFGATATARMLWIYPANDRVFPPAIARSLHAAFVRAGGQAELVAPQAPSTDGHDLLFAPEGPELWGGLLAFFLGSR